MFLAKTDNLELFYENRQSDLVLVTFNEMGMTANGKAFWGSNLAEKLGLSVIGFVSTQPNWFPGRDMAELLPTVQTLCGGYGRVVLYGHSQGAYAALKYGVALRATHAISFCPQFSIEPDIIQNIDNRYHGYFQPDLHQDMALKPGEAIDNSYVFYDPFDLRDRRHIALIADVMPKVKLIKVPMSGHETILLFRGTALFARMLDLCLEGRVDELTRMGNKARKSSSLRVKYASMISEHRHPAFADAILAAHQDRLNPKQLSDALYFGAAMALKKKDWTRARWKIDAALCLFPDNQSFHTLKDGIEQHANEH